MNLFAKYVFDIDNKRIIFTENIDGVVVIDKSLGINIKLGNFFIKRIGENDIAICYFDTDEIKICSGLLNSTFTIGIIVDDIIGFIKIINKLFFHNISVIEINNKCDSLEYYLSLYCTATMSSCIMDYDLLTNFIDKYNAVLYTQIYMSIFYQSAFNENPIDRLFETNKDLYLTNNKYLHKYMKLGWCDSMDCLNNKAKYIYINLRELSKLADSIIYHSMTYAKLGNILIAFGIIESTNGKGMQRYTSSDGSIWKLAAKINFNKLKEFVYTKVKDLNMYIYENCENILDLNF